MGGEGGVGLWDLYVFKPETCFDPECMYGGTIPQGSRLEIKHPTLQFSIVTSLFHSMVLVL